MSAELNGLSALEAARRIQSGEISSEELVQACMDRIEEREPTIHAWKFLDPELALAQARQRDGSEIGGPLREDVATGVIHMTLRPDPGLHPLSNLLFIAGAEPTTR